MLAVASSPGGIARLLYPPCYAPRNRTGAGVKENAAHRSSELLRSCNSAPRIQREALARCPLPSVGMQASCKPKILAGEKLTRILARQLLQCSLASVLKSVRSPNESFLGLKTLVVGSKIHRLFVQPPFCFLCLVCRISEIS